MNYLDRRLIAHFIGSHQGILGTMELPDVLWERWFTVWYPRYNEYRSNPSANDLRAAITMILENQ